MEHTLVNRRPARRARRNVNRFEIRPAAAGGFIALERALARKLKTLSASPLRHAVIVSLGGDGNYFTQTLVDRECGALVEAVSSRFIMEGHELEVEQQRLLEILGFAAPDADWPNHSQALPPPTDWRRVATLLTQPLEVVYGATPDSMVSVEVIPVSRPAYVAPHPAAVSDAGRSASPVGQFDDPDTSP